jgi:putative FmdB family regulatory protein
VPIYDYACESCGERVEVFHGVHAPGPERCERCGMGPMRKVVAAPTVHFKGTGWAKKERAASRPRARGGEEPAPEGEKASGTTPPAADGPSTPDKPTAAGSGRAPGSGTPTAGSSEG